MSNAIYAALEARLLSFAVSAPLTAAAPVLWRSEGIQEPDSGYWVEAAFMGETTGRVDDAGSQANLRGYLQATCCERRGTGAAFRLRTLAFQIADHFPKGLQLFEGGRAIKISRDTEVQSEFHDGGRLKRPVAIYWQSIG